MVTRLFSHRSAPPGLAIARGIIHDKHDGEQTFVSEEGNGTTFTIALPVE